jgi:hypothetical protein
MAEALVRLDEVWKFCSARLDDDERLARDVGFDRIETVDYLWGTRHLLLQRDDGGESKATSELDAGLAAHVARHDPRRVLADIAFKRELLAEHEPSLQAAVKDDEVIPMVVCKVDGDECPFAQGLAALYADHPDYQEAWRP